MFVIITWNKDEVEYTRLLEDEDVCTLVFDTFVEATDYTWANEELLDDTFKIVELS
jgi:hypothetical protein